MEEYLVDLNATQAAIRAGYSERTAKVIASENLTKPNIQQALVKRRDEVFANVTTPEMIMKEFARIGFSDIRDYMSWNQDGVRFKPSDEIPQDAARAISEVSETVTKDGGTVRFKLHDKKGALDSLAKYFNLFIDQQDLQEQKEIRITVTYEDEK